MCLQAILAECVEAWKSLGAVEFPKTKNAELHMRYFMHLVILKWLNQKYKRKSQVCFL